jgi:hypothetical protein
MEGHEFLGKMTKVGAPGGFEEAVLARLPAARRQRRQARRARFVYAFAGSAALILTAVLLYNPAAPEKDAVLTYAERQALAADADRGARAADPRTLPVYETMDYASEFRNAQPQPATVYILEQVSEIPLSEIIY